MINHVVLLKLKKYPETEKARIVKELKSLLEGLKEKIKEVKYLEVGTNYELQAKSFDIVLISHFESVENLNKYRVHPEHLKVLERINETTDQRAAVDYKF